MSGELPDLTSEAYKEGRRQGYRDLRKVIEALVKVAISYGLPDDEEAEILKGLGQLKQRYGMGLELWSDE